jgi:hypothetical protein
MQDTTDDDGPSGRIHHVLVVDVWQRPDQVDRLRSIRSADPDADPRDTVVDHLGEVVEGEGVDQDVWDARVRRPRPRG